MSWNPDNKDKDPWGNRPGNQGPPDLDEVVKKMQEGLGKIFSGGGGQKKVVLRTERAYSLNCRRFVCIARLRNGLSNRSS